MTATPDLIPRSAVLEAIDEWIKRQGTVQSLRHTINHMPAAPVDSTPAPQPADFGPCVVCGRSVLEPHWGIVHSGCAAQFRNPQPAPQPAIDYTAMTPAQLVKFIFSKTECDTREGAPENLGLLGVCARTISELIAPQPALDVAGLVARASEVITGPECRDCEALVDVLCETSQALTTLAAALKQERERAERAETEAAELPQWIAREEYLAARLAEVEREREVLQAKLEALQATDAWQAQVNLYKELMEEQKTRADAAEQALAEAQATLGRLGEVECIESLDGETWNFRDDDGRFCSWPTLRIRRVLDAGGAG